MDQPYLTDYTILSVNIQRKIFNIQIFKHSMNQIIQIDIFPKLIYFSLLFLFLFFRIVQSWEAKITKWIFQSQIAFYKRHSRERKLTFKDEAIWIVRFEWTDPKYTLCFPLLIFWGLTQEKKIVMSDVKNNNIGPVMTSE